MMRIANDANKCLTRKALKISAMILMLSLIFVNGASATGPGFSFSELSNTVKVGDSFSIDVLVNPNGTALDTARVEVSFPVNKLEITSFNLATLFPQPAGLNSIDTVNGLLYEGGAIFNGTTTTSGVFGTIVFKAKASGSAALSITTNSRLIRDGVEKIDLTNLGTRIINIQSLELPKQCGDGVDNDADGKIDYPADPGCSSLTDDNETDALPVYQCNDGFDNDADGKTDMDDPGCSSLTDNDETNALVKPEEPEEPKEPEEQGEPEQPVERRRPDEPSRPVQSGDDNDWQSEPEDQAPLTNEEIVEQAEQVAQSEEVRQATDAVANVVNQITRIDKVVVQETIQQSVKAVVQTTKQAQKVNEQVSAPALSVVAATSVAAVATVGATSTAGLTILVYLQFIISQLITFFTRRRKQNWGVVYNSITKQPIDLAVVRVYDATTNRLVATRVSDRQGRYQFILNPGKYLVKVEKSEYKFPCGLLNQAKVDDKFENVYYGEPVELKAKDVLALAIPVDPDRRVEENKKLLRKNWWRKWQAGLTWLGPCLGAVSFALNPRWWVAALVLTQLAMVFVFRRLSGMRRSGNFGIVRDALKKKSLAQAVVRVFDNQYNKLLETQITDRNGRYGFLVGRQIYYLTGDKEGYQPYRSAPVDLVAKSSTYLAENIELRPGKNDMAQKTSSPAAPLATVEPLKPVVLSAEEKTVAPIAGVEQKDLHEDFYQVDSLSGISNDNNSKSEIAK